MNTPEERLARLNVEKMPGKSQIMQAVRKGLDVLPDWDAEMTYGVSTQAVLNELCRIGLAFGCEVCVTGDVDRVRNAVQNDEERRYVHNEWLYDVTWVRYEVSEEGRNLIDVPLVAECEWGNFDKIRRDFDKLLLARAGIRLMIFDGHQNVEGHMLGPLDIAERLADRVRNFNDSRAEDAWLLAAWEWPEEDKDWRFRYFTIVPNTAEVYPFPRE